ncbi:MAG: hypothetical protein V4607_16525 [Pseudomonadota bacterium]
MHIMKKACGLLAVAILGSNIAACSHADKGGGTTVTVVVPVAQNANGDPAPLTVSPSTVSIGTPATLNWSVQGASNCTASGGAANDTWRGNQPTTSPSAGVQVGPYSTPGNYTYVLTCTSSTGGVLSQTATLTVGNVPSTIGVNLTSSSATAKPGETVSLNWTTTGNPTGCTASSNPAVSGWSGSKPVTSSTAGTWLTLPDAGSYVFTLTCSGPGGTTTSNVPVTVSSTADSAKPLLLISSNPSSVAQGTSSLIEWTTANASSCAATSNQAADGWNGSAQPVNDFNSSTAAATFSTANSLSPGTYNYALTCTGLGGTASQTAQLLVTNGNGSAGAVPGLTFAISNSTTPTGNNSTAVKVGSVVYLSWVSSNATSCMATGGTWAPSSQPTSQNNLVQGPFNSPGNYSFALSCTNASGNSVAQVVQVTVTSNGPSVSFSAQPNPATQGTQPTLVWTASDDATSCTATSGPMEDTSWTGTKPTSGSYSVPSSVYNAPGTYQYVLTCTGPSGTTTVPVSLVVNPSSTGGPQFTTAFTASPASLPASGGTTSLTWATSNATACTASSNPAVTGWSGSQPTSSPSGGTSVTLPANNTATPVSYTLELSCSNASGTSTQSQVVMVQGTIPAPTVTLSANPVMLEAGPAATTTLSYSTSNVTSCTTTGGNATGVWATQPTPNAGSTVVTGTANSTPMTSAGSYTYTLSCTGPGGTATAVPVVVTVTSPAPSFLPVKGQSPTAAGLFVSTTSGSTTPATQVTPGGDLYFSWNASNATSCVPTSNEPGTSGWKDTATDISGDDVVAKASDVPGFYNYTITCSGPTNPAAVSTVSVLVMSPTANLCPGTGGTVMDPSMALLVDTAAPSYAATTPSTSGLCLGCSVSGLPNVTDEPTSTPTPPSAFPFNFDNFATMSLPVGVLTPGATTINVRNTSATAAVYPVGRNVYVGLTVPSSLLTADVLSNVSIATTLNGNVQDITPSGTLLTLQLLGLLGNGSSGYAALTATKPFDGVQINYGGTVSAISNLRVHMACVSLQ